MNRLIVSPSPHDENYTKTSDIMLNVSIALLPALIAGCIFFGIRAAVVTAVCVISAVVSEYICRRLMKRDNTIKDLSAVVTGIILAFNLPVSIPLWMAALGSFIAIVVVKQLFGGLGQNFANPAVTARIALMVSFPTAMTNWVLPFEWKNSADAITGATPLVLRDMTPEKLAEINQEIPSCLDLFLGNTGGCIGETSALALLLGGLYLIAIKIINPAAPVAFIGSLALISLIAGENPLYEILAGGVFLGAFFMITDYATTPITTKGKIVFGIGCGIITFVIRRYASLPEGVSFSILLMNILTPYIEQHTRPKVFGAKEAVKNEK